MTTRMVADAPSSACHDETRTDVAGAPRGAAAIRSVWWLLAALVGAEAAQRIFGVGEPAALYTQWFHDTVMIGAAALCFVRAVNDPRLRTAWLCFGAAQSSWALSSVIGSVVYDRMASPPYPSASDYIWLAWYPFVAAGIALLARAHVPRFALERWMDGLSAVLVVLTAGVALVLQPLAEKSRDTEWATLVNFSFPVLDVLLIGGILGVYGLLSWHVGRMWLAIAAGCIVATIPDVVFAVQEARGITRGEGLDFAWTAGAVLIAYAAWASDFPPEARSEPFGWRAIVLAVAAQVFAGTLQIYGLFHPVDWSERVVTLAVLVVATVQIVVSRPRKPSG
jgi:hypothetical protein